MIKWDVNGGKVYAQISIYSLFIEQVHIRFRY